MVEFSKVIALYFDVFSNIISLLINVILVIIISKKRKLLL